MRRAAGARRDIVLIFAIVVALASLTVTLTLGLRSSLDWQSMAVIVFAAFAGGAGAGVLFKRWNAIEEDRRVEEPEDCPPFNQLGELERLASLLTGSQGQYGVGKQIQRCRTVAALLLSTNADGDLVLSRQQVSALFYKLIAMDDYLSDVLVHPALWLHPRSHDSREQLRMAMADTGPELYHRIMEKNGLQRPFSGTRMQVMAPGEPTDPAAKALAAAKQELAR